MKEKPQFNLRLPPDIKEWVERKAKEDDRSMTYVIVRVLRNAKYRDEMREAA